MTAQHKEYHGQKTKGFHLKLQYVAFIFSYSVVVQLSRQNNASLGTLEYCWRDRRIWSRNLARTSSRRPHFQQKFILLTHSMGTNSGISPHFAQSRCYPLQSERIRLLVGSLRLELGVRSLSGTHRHAALLCFSASRLSQLQYTSHVACVT